MKETIIYRVQSRCGSSHYGNLDAPSYDKAVENARTLCDRTKDSPYPVDINKLAIFKRTVSMEKIELDK